MAVISEQEITKATLSYLKSHYRYREREGATQLSSNRRGAGGIVADGFLSFPKAGGELFRATVEATSLPKKHEVAYKLRRPLLRWDSAALASLITAGLYTAGYYQGSWRVAELTALGVAGGILIVFLITFLSFLLLLRGMRRYRYIYAIEQFKQYFADEQWIAVGEDVFVNFTRDSKYLELKRQCIYNGFGLVVVREDGRPQLQVSPARQDLFKNKRRQVSLLAEPELKRLMPPGGVPDWMQQFKGTNLRRYKYQLFFCLAALVLCSVLFAEDLEQEKTIEIEEREEYLARVSEARERNERIVQPLYFVIDTPLVWPYPIRSDVEAYLGVGLQLPQAEILPGPEASSRQGFIAQLDPEGQETVYDCSRIRHLSGPTYILQFDQFASFSAANARLQQMEEYGFAASALYLSCFDEGEQGYALYLGLMFDSLEQARSGLRYYEQRLGDNVLGLELRIRSLTPLVEP